MAISDELLKILVCPECKGPLFQHAESDGLLCKRCSRRYPVRDGIPVLLVEEAENIFEHSP